MRVLLFSGSESESLAEEKAAIHREVTSEGYVPMEDRVRSLGAQYCWSSLLMAVSQLSFEYEAETKILRKQVNRNVQDRKRERALDRYRERMWDHLRPALHEAEWQEERALRWSSAAEELRDAYGEVMRYALNVVLHHQVAGDLDNELIEEDVLDTGAETSIWREVKGKYNHPTKAYDPSTLERIRKFEGVMAGAGLESAVLHQLEEKAKSDDERLGGIKVEVKPRHLKAPSIYLFSWQPKPAVILPQLVALKAWFIEKVDDEDKSFKEGLLRMMDAFITSAQQQVEEAQRDEAERQADGIDSWNVPTDDDLFAVVEEEKAAVRRAWESDAPDLSGPAFDTSVQSLATHPRDGASPSDSSAPTTSAFSSGTHVASDTGQYNHGQPHVGKSARTSMSFGKRRAHLLMCVLVRLSFLSYLVACVSCCFQVSIPSKRRRLQFVASWNLCPMPRSWTIISIPARVPSVRIIAGPRCWRRSMR
jgi:hypothetical protein